jgi:ubiquinone/menaquinone biosynthesis C-methylase UbiE
LPSAQSYKQKSRDRFDSVASSYGNHLAGRHAAKLYPVVVKAVDELSPSSVLDVGCGNGNLLALLNNSSRKLAGADLSPEMLRHAWAKLGDGIDLKVTDSENLPWNPGSFDAITCTDSFHHYPNPAQVLLEMRRVLKPGGYIVIADPWAPAPFRWIVNFLFRFGISGDVKLYSTAEWRRMMDAAGFQLSRLENQSSSMLLVARSAG